MAEDDVKILRNK